PPLGLRQASELLAGEYRPIPPWLGAHEPHSFYFWVLHGAWVGWLFVPVSLLTAALVLARRRRLRSAADAVTLVALLNVAAVISIATLRIEGLTPVYDFFWRITLAVMLVVVCAIAIVASVGVWRRRAVRIAAAFVLSLGIVVPVGIETAAATRPD